MIEKLINSYDFAIELLVQEIDIEYNKALNELKQYGYDTRRLYN